MSKRLHPIRKLRRALWAADIDKQEPVIARHVKPLLNALEEGHQFCRDNGEEGNCAGCRLLAAWRAKP